MSFVDPDGEFPWLAAIIIAGFTYLSNAQANTPKGKDPGNPGNWSYNPLDWFKDGGHGFYITGGYNPNGGDVYLNATYYNNSLQITGGIAKGDNYFSYGGGVYYDGYGASYYRTNYGSSIAPGGTGERVGSQTVGEYGVQIRGYSVRVSNDLFGDGRDRWRSSAVEIGVGDFIIGKQVYTNAPNQNPDTRILDLDYKSSFWNKTGIGTYRDSEVYSSPFYIGRRQGTNVLRLGINHPVVQDITQNGFHLLIGSPLLYTPYGKYSSRYIYSGYHNPYSIY